MFILLVAIIFFLPLSSSQLPCYSNGVPVACEPPRIDDLLRGRVPVVTSTCGVERAERVCERVGGSCTTCDSAALHSPSLMTDGSPDTYWLSQTYHEVSGGVNVTFHLGKTFAIETIVLVFYSPRPHSLSLYVSSDHASTFHPLHFFSESCRDIYGLPVTDSSQGERTLMEPTCSSEGVGLLPLTEGTTIFRSPSLILATDIQIRLDHLHTLGNQLTWNSTVLDSYWYALSNVSATGHCFCNGHGSSCKEDDDGVFGCQCSHNTTGQDCQMCLTSHNDQLWMRAASEEVTECKGLCRVSHS